VPRCTVTCAKQSFELDLEGDTMHVALTVPEGAEVYTVVLAKPLGIVIEGVRPFFVN
jgi:hypothetical protein